MEIKSKHFYAYANLNAALPCDFNNGCVRDGSGNPFGPSRARAQKIAANSPAAHAGNDSIYALSRRRHAIKKAGTIRLFNLDGPALFEQETDRHIGRNIDFADGYRFARRGVSAGTFERHFIHDRLRVVNLRVV